MALEIQVMAWDSHKGVAWLNQLMETSPLDNWIPRWHPPPTHTQKITDSLNLINSTHFNKRVSPAPTPLASLVSRTHT